MTNLEANKDEIKKRIKNGENFGCAICEAKNKHCPQCCGDDGDDILCNVVDWLSEEYKEPIKLKDWEFELIGYIYRNSSNKMNFVSYSVLNYLRGVGFFKGITNADMKLSEIIENCEVVDD